MGDSRISYAIDCRYQRPISVVRAHFLDMRHHIEHGVHKGVDYTILEEAGDRCRIRQKFKVMGMTKVDELDLYSPSTSPRTAPARPGCTRPSTSRCAASTGCSSRSSSARSRSWPPPRSRRIASISRSSSTSRRAGPRARPR
jgi:hypothetical protein